MTCTITLLTIDPGPSLWFHYNPSCFPFSRGNPLIHIPGHSAPDLQDSVTLTTHFHTPTYYYSSGGVRRRWWCASVF